jgi:hypothetical protein
VNRQFTYIGTLPAGGDWRFCLVQIAGQADVIVVADMKGKWAPRMIVKGKLIEVAPLA